MEISLKLSTLIIATLLTGLSAGLCFTWTNAVTAGLARLTDDNYLRAFQEMNRSILNPSFFIVFFGPVITIAATALFYKNSATPVLWMLIAAALLYFFGVALVTIFGNVPINEVLNNTDLNQISTVDAQALRSRFENDWLRLHRIRTYTSGLSFLLLILVCTWKDMPVNY